MNQQTEPKTTKPTNPAPQSAPFYWEPAEIRTPRMAAIESELNKPAGEAPAPWVIEIR
jgi:hypothetical protein